MKHRNLSCISTFFTFTLIPTLLPCPLQTLLKAKSISSSFSSQSDRRSPISRHSMFDRFLLHRDFVPYLLCYRKYRYPSFCRCSSSFGYPCLDTHPPVCIFLPIVYFSFLSFCQGRMFLRMLLEDVGLFGRLRRGWKEGDWKWGMDFGEEKDGAWGSWRSRLGKHGCDLICLEEM